MNLQDLAALMGKTVDEIKEMFEKDGVIELKLSDRKTKGKKENGAIEAI